MRDEMDARLWGEHHQAFSTQVDGLTGRIMDVFRLLHRLNWTAPWQPDGSPNVAPRAAKNLSAAAGALLFGSIMILSAVTPAQTQVDVARNDQAPVTRYLA